MANLSQREALLRIQGIVQMQTGHDAVLAIRNVLMEAGLGLCLPNLDGRFVEYEVFVEEMKKRDVRGGVAALIKDEVARGAAPAIASGAVIHALLEEELQPAGR